MGVIGADDLQRLLARLADGVKVILWLDDESAPRIRGSVSRCDGSNHMVPSTQQEATAFVRRLPSRVSEDRVFGRLRQNHTSTTIAMPIPPPMQSAATPRPPPRLVKA